MLARFIAARVPPGDYLVVPVPLHRWRLWRRGFNQSALLAAQIARRLKADLCVDALIRSKHTRFLGGLGKRARVKELSGAITLSARQADKVRGRDILLIDDVLTSGATSEACVSALKRAGAQSVRIGCFARVLEEALSDTANRSAQKNETPEAEAPGAA